MWICQVDAGLSAPIQIVTGAQNVKERCLNVQQFGENTLCAALYLRLVESAWHVKRSGYLPGQTNDREAVGTVGSNHLVIADETRAVGLAGIMGGENSEIVDDTVDVVFESANFDGTCIRKGALALGMRTDASAKFEYCCSRKNGPLPQPGRPFV